MVLGSDRRHWALEWEKHSERQKHWALALRNWRSCSSTWWSVPAVTQTQERCSPKRQRLACDRPPKGLLPQRPQLRVGQRIGAHWAKVQQMRCEARLREDEVKVAAVRASPLGHCHCLGSNLPHWPLDWIQWLPLGRASSGACCCCMALHYDWWPP